MHPGTMARNARPLNEQACHCGLPAPETPPGGESTSPPILSRPRLCLNPRFAELLMGLPPGWTSIRSPIDPIAFARWAIRFALHVRRLLCSTSSSATEVTDDHRRMPS